MRVDLTAEITNFDGKSIKVADGDKGLTLGECIQNALLLGSTESLKGPEKLARFVLAQKTYNVEEIELTSEETTLIKETAAVVFSPLVMGRIYELIDPASFKKD